MLKSNAAIRLLIGCMAIGLVGQPLYGQTADGGPGDPAARGTEVAAPGSESRREAPATANTGVSSQEGAVTGEVVDAESGEPARGVNVIIPELRRGMITDSDGRFRLEGLPEGSYTLRVTGLGYETAERTIRIEAGQTLALNIRLTPKAVALQELVVSPRMREEVTREVPITETVFGSEELEDAGVDYPQRVLDLTPNASLVNSQNVGTAFITVRGISQQRNTETPVAIVVDDVLQVTPNQFNQALFDVERVEVLKGPQGALYGRNAVAGAILIETKEPTNEFEGYLRGGGGNGEHYQLSGAVGGPIVKDELLFRVAARYQNEDGFLMNDFLDQTVDYFENFTGRAKLRWLATPRFRVDFQATVDRVSGGGQHWQYQPAILAEDGVTLDPDNPFPFDFDQINSNSVDRTLEGNNRGRNDRDYEQMSLRLNYDLDFASLESITAYTRLEEFYAGDQFPYTAGTSREITGFGHVDGTAGQYFDIDAWSQELRLLSPQEQDFRWMMGFYYLAKDRFISTPVGEDRGMGIVRLEREPDFANPRNPTVSWIADDNDNEAWAVFGNVAYDVVPELEVSAAVRYDRDHRDQFVDEQQTVGVPGAVNRRTYDQVQPKFTVGYTPEIDSDVLGFINLYGSWGVGFRSGQFNQNGVAEAAEEAGIEGVKDVVDAEVARTFELGFKTTWFQDRLSLDASFFRTHDENMPFFLFVGPVSAQVLVNTPESEILGFESLARAKLAPGLDAYLGVGYTHTEIEAFPLNPDNVGNRLPLVPKTTVNAGAQYRREIVDGIGIFTRIDYERRGQQAWEPANTTPRDALDLVDVKAGVESGAWTARFEMDNATDEVYNAEFVAGGFAWPARPDRWRVVGTYRF